MKTLKDLRNTPDDQIRDDDHLERKDISGKEFDNIMDDVFKDVPKKTPAEKKEVDPFGQATIDALKKIKPDKSQD